MTRTKESPQIKWRELIGPIRQQWGKLTQEDLSRMDNGMNELTTLLRKRYGYWKAQAELEINKWLKGLELRVIKSRR